MYDIQIMQKKISLLIKKFLKKYFTLPNFGSYQNHKIFVYQIENQT